MASRQHGPAPGEEFLDAIDYSLEVASTAPYGHTVLLKLKLRNTSDEPAQFFTGGRPPHDFIITTADGEEVWNWLCARIRLLPLDGRMLQPGEELDFVGEWEQVDYRGEPIPAGTHFGHWCPEFETPGETGDITPPAALHPDQSRQEPRERLHRVRPLPPEGRRGPGPHHAGQPRFPH